MTKGPFQSALTARLAAIHLFTASPIGETVDFYTSWGLEALPVPSDEATTTARFRSTGTDHHVLQFRNAGHHGLELIEFTMGSRSAVDAYFNQISGLDPKAIETRPGALSGASGGYGFTLRDLEGRRLQFGSERLAGILGPSGSPVFILLFGLGGTSKVLLVAVECFYPVVFNVAAGAQGISRDFMWHSFNVEASLWRRVKDLILPSTLPAILTGLRIAAPLMLVVEVVTEMIGESRGLGFMIMDARSRFDPPTVFAVIVVLALGGYFLDRIVQILTRQLVFWERDVRI